MTRRDEADGVGMGFLRGGPDAMTEWSRWFVAEIAALQERIARMLGYQSMAAAFVNSAPVFCTKATDPSRYPHVCPRCNGPAYVGAVEVDCAGGCK